MDEACHFAVCVCWLSLLHCALLGGAADVNIVPVLYVG